MSATSVARRLRQRLRDHRHEAASVGLSVLCLAVMLAFPNWQAVPFHIVWTTLTLVYGFRLWRMGATLLAVQHRLEAIEHVRDVLRVELVALKAPPEAFGA